MYHLRKLTLACPSLYSLIIVLGFFLVFSSCSKIEEDDLSLDQSATPALSVTPSANLLQYMVSYIGDDIQTNNIHLIPSLAMANIGGAEPYMIQSVQNAGKFWLVPIKNNLTSVGARVTYRVPPALKTFYQGADFVMVATIEDANHPYSIGVRQASRNVCENGTCIAKAALVDAGALDPADLCGLTGSCSGSGQGNSQLKTCFVRNCFLGTCKMTTLRIDGLLNCPPDGCSTSADCSNSDEKTCYYRKCSNVGLINLCESVTVTVPSSDPCPGDECTSNSDCEEETGGGLGTILETLGF